VRTPAHAWAILLLGAVAPGMVANPAFFTAPYTPKGGRLTLAPNKRDSRLDDDSQESRPIAFDGSFLRFRPRVGVSARGTGCVRPEFNLNRTPGLSQLTP
jgi:hypothetical protein